jgi:hypothetical protein
VHRAPPKCVRESRYLNETNEHRQVQRQTLHAAPKRVGCF